MSSLYFFKRMNKCEVVECFDGLIGVFGCHNVGDCKQFVNDIPGISNELLENITDSERSSYRQVFEKALTAAINSLKLDIRTAMYDDKERQEFGGSIYSTEKARLLNPKQFQIVTNEYVGVLLSTAKSKYVSCDFKSITLYSKNDTTVTPIIYDYDTEEVINTGDTISILANKKTIINYNFQIDCSKHRAVFFGLQLTEPIELSLLSCNRFTENASGSCYPCESVCGDGTELDFKKGLDNLFADKSDEYAIYNIVTDEFLNTDSYVEIETLICADLELKCSIDSFICDNKESISDALIYLVATNILTEKLNSRRQNMWAKGNLEFTLILREELQKQYKGNLKKIIPTLPMSGDSLCWECVEHGVWTESMI